MSEEKVVALDQDNAVRIIVAAIEAGQIRLPFSGSLDREKILEEIRDRVSRNVEGSREERVQKISPVQVAKAVAGLARLDALYILTIYETLRAGLTKKESDDILTAILD